ncbi:uncharacterized protein LOC119280017 [Triticum dicoccoides]|uniref:uncharacterized protein LOC119280017 n=1 Tax=Triticum dicoccoides TaxID=85692 RepID=UPI00188E464F|nr:uncharacterized protein LOC119280017 [Triticum dicoccoides]
MSNLHDAATPMLRHRPPSIHARSSAPNASSSPHSPRGTGLLCFAPPKQRPRARAPSSTPRSSKRSLLLEHAPRTMAPSRAPPVRAFTRPRRPSVGSFGMGMAETPRAFCCLGAPPFLEFWTIKTCCPDMNPHKTFQGSPSTSTDGPEHLQTCMTTVARSTVGHKHRERLPSPKSASTTTSTTRRVRLPSLGFDKTPSTTTFAMYIYTKTGSTSALRTYAPLPSSRTESTTTSHRTCPPRNARFDFEVPVTLHL